MEKKMWQIIHWARLVEPIYNDHESLQDRCARASESALTLVFMCDPFQRVTVQMIFTKLKYTCSVHIS